MLELGQNFARQFLPCFCLTKSSGSWEKLADLAPKYATVKPEMGLRSAQKQAINTDYRN